jgi:hypothetical protein
MLAKPARVPPPVSLHGVPPILLVKYAERYTISFHVYTPSIGEFVGSVMLLE